MSRIVFTSCIRRKSDKDMQPQWQAILDKDPDVLILSGDHIYMDFGYWPFSREYTGLPKSYSAKEFRRIMQAKYELQWREPHFKALINHMKAKNGLIATWDDHDFAWNNACGRDVPDEIKAISKELFLQYLSNGETRDELYAYYDIPGARIIVLDTRFYAEQSHYKKPNATLLGDKQWQFLTDSIQHSQGVTLLVSAISLNKGLENWQRYPAEYQKLQTVLKRHPNTILIAGDIHTNRFIKPSTQHPCYELISSGIAVNQLGLPFGITDQRNWGFLELKQDKIAVELHDKRGFKNHFIPINTVLNNTSI